MRYQDPRQDTTHRTRDAHERPREFNDPSRLDTQTAYYQGRHLHWFKLVLILVPFLAALAVVGFIVFNLLTD